MKNGQALQLLLARIQETIAKTQQDEKTKEFAEALSEALTLTTETTLQLIQVAQSGKINLYLANATLYLHLLGHLVVAWLWLEQAHLATDKLQSASENDQHFYLGKINACMYFYRWELPKTQHWSTLLQKLDRTTLDMPIQSVLTDKTKSHSIAKKTITFPRKVWIDADACPKGIKEVLYRAAEKRELPTCLVANHRMYTPTHPMITQQLVPKGFDVADAYIVQHLEEDDVVITADLPFAALIIEKGGHALSPRGDLFTEEKYPRKTFTSKFFPRSP